MLSSAPYYCSLWPPALCAQEVVSVGKGSYASKPPEWLEGLDFAKPVTESQSQVPRHQPGRSPDPHQRLVHEPVHRRRGLRVVGRPDHGQARRTGHGFYAGTRWKGHDIAKVDPLTQSTARALPPPTHAAEEWSDWMLKFRAVGSDSKYYNVTLMRGCPMAWVEFTGMNATGHRSPAAQTNLLRRRGHGRRHARPRATRWALRRAATTGPSLPRTTRPSRSPAGN